MRLGRAADWADQADGGFIPHTDHLVPPDVSFENYLYYRRRKCEIIGKPWQKPGIDRRPGLIQDWLILGPFGNSGNQGFHAALAPEQGLDFTLVYPGKGDQPIRWQACRQRTASGYVDLAESIGREEWCVAYAACHIFTPFSRDGWLELGLSNEQIVDLDRVRVPADLASGSYRWRVSIGSGGPIELGELRVTAPNRSFERPSITNPVNQTFGERVILLGQETSCTQQSQGDRACHVKLWWRAAQDMPESYKVFVHLLDASGVPRAQADVIPVNGTRPTWSWLPGEIITDEIVVKIPADLPAGAYHLTTGLYSELDGKRLTLPDGKDYIELRSNLFH